MDLFRVLDLRSLVLLFNNLMCIYPTRNLLVIWLID